MRNTIEALKQKSGEFVAIWLCAIGATVIGNTMKAGPYDYSIIYLAAIITVIGVVIAIIEEEAIHA